MVLDTIIFTTTYAYLAIPQYKHITPELNNYRKILFDTKDLLSIAYDQNFITQEVISNFFDDFLELDQVSFDVKGKWRKYLVFRKYKKQILSCLNEIRPKAVISCSDQAISDKIITNWCKNNNKAFIILQPAFIDVLPGVKYGVLHKIKYFIFNKLFKVPKYRRQVLFGNEAEWTNLLLWSEYFIENPKRKNMAFVGNPAFDKIFNAFKPTRTLKNNAIICTQDIDILIGNEKYNQVLKTYSDAIKAKPEITFYIKVHPRESIQKYKKLFDINEFSNVKIVKERNLYDLFEICDVQISVSSYTSFEAAAKGLPIIIVNPNNIFNFFDHFRQEIEIRVTDAEDLIKAIDTSRTEQYWEKFLVKREKYFNFMVYSIDGQSGKRAAEKINEIIQANN